MLGTAGGYVVGRLAKAPARGDVLLGLAGVISLAAAQRRANGGAVELPWSARRAIEMGILEVGELHSFASKLCHDCPRHSAEPLHQFYVGGVGCDDGR